MAKNMTIEEHKFVQDLELGSLDILINPNKCYDNYRIKQITISSEAPLSEKLSIKKIDGVDASFDVLMYTQDIVGAEDVVILSDNDFLFKHDNTIKITLTNLNITPGVPNVVYGTVLLDTL